MPAAPMRLRDLPDDLNAISGQIFDAAIEVHTTLGRYLSEETYQTCLAHELGLRGYVVSIERPVPLRYKSLVVPNARRMDLLVEEKVVVELKCVEKLDRDHEAQLMDYLHFSGCRLGFLFNFHAPRIRDDFRRRAVSHPADSLTLRGPPRTPQPPRSDGLDG